MGKFLDAFFGVSKSQKRITLTPIDSDSFQMVWERKKLPGPGAMNYAWEVLGLPQFSPIGPSVRVRQPIQPMANQPVVTEQKVPVQGLPTVTGGIVSQPLFDPNAGYGFTPTEYNLPFDTHGIAPAGAGILG